MTLIIFLIYCGFIILSVIIKDFFLRCKKKKDINGFNEP